MAFQIVFKKNISEPNKLDKSFSGNGLSLTGTLRNETSVINPTIIIQYDINLLSKYNYCTIGTLNRDYFITDMKSIRQGIIEVYLHVDVLSTYKTGIRSNRAIIARNEKQYDLLLNDGLFKTQQKPRIAQFPFSAGFNQWNFVLGIAGN